MTQMWLKFQQWFIDSLLKFGERLAGGIPGLDEWKKQIADFRKIVDDSIDQDRKASQDRVDRLRNELATLRGRAAAEADYPEQTQKTTTPLPVPAMANATSAGTFSAAAARIMFMGQGENYQKRTADATEETAKMIRRMRNVNPVFVGYGV